MKINRAPFALTAILVTTMIAQLLTAAAGQPNLLIIHTDEHNFRTLGCYRDLMSDDQSFIWGEGVMVETPHIDSLARDGAICTSYYAASPVCTPSRAAFVSGTYPVATGAWTNDTPMHDSVVTFAEQLGNNGYATAYVGKWHLDGDPKPGFEPQRDFGFSDNRHMFNRGHWKVLEMVGDRSKVYGEPNKKGEWSYSMNGADETSFTTDFLTDRVIEIMDRDKDGPFCVMLSIPDPHGPNSVRAPYDTLFKDMHFNDPRTKNVPSGDFPKWNSQSGKNAAGELNQKQMQQYFGMVRCIDDNVGRLLNYLKENDLEKNTIVVFTSDHGDLMGEHNRHNKGLPYETSAKIPFIIRYPGKIPAGKVIRKAYTNVDFTPTILGLTGVPQVKGTHGLDDSMTFLSEAGEIVDDRIVYFSNSGSAWVAAVNNRYKLVISPSDVPWLFDLQRDPDELRNFAREPEYASITDKFQKELIRQMKQFNDRAVSNANVKLNYGKQ